jgi:hypothetical protein
MPDFPNLTNDNVTIILEYIRQVNTFKKISCRNNELKMAGIKA